MSTDVERDGSGAVSDRRRRGRHLRSRFWRERQTVAQVVTHHSTHREPGGCEGAVKQQTELQKDVVQRRVDALDLRIERSSREGSAKQGFLSPRKTRPYFSLPQPLVRRDHMSRGRC